MEIFVDILVTSQDSTECGRDFETEYEQETYTGRLGAIVVGDVSELYLLTTEPRVYSTAVTQTPERMAYIMSDDIAAAANIAHMLSHAVRVAEA